MILDDYFIPIFFGLVLVIIFGWALLATRTRATDANRARCAPLFHQAHTLADSANVMTVYNCAAPRGK